MSAHKDAMKKKTNLDESRFQKRPGKSCIPTTKTVNGADLKNDSLDEDELEDKAFDDAELDDDVIENDEHEDDESYPSSEISRFNKKKAKSLYRRFTDWLIAHTGTPHTIALGFAVGIFVALTPTVGFQMILGALFAHLLGANRLIAAALAWITNPLTIVPIYYFNYQVGLIFIHADASRGKAFIHALSKVSLFRPSTLLEGIRLTAVEFAGIAGVLWVGSLIIATILSLVSYPLIKRLVKAERRLAEIHRQKRLQRKKIREERKKAQKLKRKPRKK